MINRDMRLYGVYQYGNKNSYGQRELNKEPVDEVFMAIYTTSQAIQDNINYKSATYVGFTYKHLENIHVIKYGETYLKVLYVNPQGKLNQVFMAEI